jgi:hypothetical protein
MVWPKVTPLSGVQQCVLRKSLQTIKKFNLSIFFWMKKRQERIITMSMLPTERRRERRSKRTSSKER